MRYVPVHPWYDDFVLSLDACWLDFDVEQLFMRCGVEIAAETAHDEDSAMDAVFAADQCFPGTFDAWSCRELPHVCSRVVVVPASVLEEAVSFLQVFGVLLYDPIEYEKATEQQAILSAQRLQMPP